MGNFEETRGGVGKSGVLWRTKSAISLKRVKIEDKLLEELTNAHSNGAIPTPYGLPFPQIGSSQPTLKTAI